MKSFDVAATDIKNIREAMNGRIGEIISAVIGNDTLQKIFEKPENHQKFIDQNLKGIPSGVIALDLGIIDVDTKNALLVAQAAERIALNAERVKAITYGGDVSSEWNLSPTDNIFKFVGSERDPVLLQEAQATWQLSQIVLRASFDNGEIREESTLLKTDAEYPDTLLKAASGYYIAASNVLHQKGFEDAAVKMLAVANSLVSANDAKVSLTPHDIAQRLIDVEKDFNDMLSSTAHEGAVDNTYVVLGQKLLRLTENQKLSAPAVDTGPRKGL